MQSVVGNDYTSETSFTSDPVVPLRVICFAKNISIIAVKLSCATHGLISDQVYDNAETVQLEAMTVKRC
jgi:hypothetical protein